ncbi:MAG: hypothetical protein KME63_15955 [Candidatus Thiodiazotropha sp. (ex Clathrolucina costata)]|nr:hypothetical protein [Candidatus Thiodiazotropha taylori]MCG7863609.1 hypothetical protein [Candidatus Thiodiazotropha endolucinida]
MATEIDKVLATMNDAQGSFDGTTTTSSVQPWSEDLVSFLSTSVLIFSAIALITATILLWRIKITPELVLKTHGIILIIGFTALLLIVGYDNDQLTPIVGLFGAIAGYLLGKEITTNE